MTAFNLIDTSIWLDYFFKSKHKDIVDIPGIVLVSVLTIFDMRRKMKKDAVNPVAVEAVMDFLQKKSLVEPVSQSVAELAAELSSRHGLAAVDALIYATAQHRNAQLITQDNDFRGLPGVIVRV